jgi:hypothetical protein
MFPHTPILHSHINTKIPTGVIACCCPASGSSMTSEVVGKPLHPTWNPTAVSRRSMYALLSCDGMDMGHSDSPGCNRHQSCGPLNVKASSGKVDTVPPEVAAVDDLTVRTDGHLHQPTPSGGRWFVVRASAASGLL